MASADAASHDDHDDHGDDQVPSALQGMLKDNHEWFYFKTWGILTVLFIISFVGPFVGEALNLWILTMITAFGIAVVKAGLVIVRFMHLFDEPKFIWQMNVTALVFMGLFFFWVAPDVMHHVGRNWDNQAGAAPTTTAHIEDFDVNVVWTERCATCHGAEGGGDGAEGTAIYPRPTDFTTQAYWVNANRERIAAAILDGGAVEGVSGYMPAYRTTLAPGHGAGHEVDAEAMVAERVEQLVGLIEGFRPPPEPAPVAVPTPAPTPAPAPVPTPAPAVEDTVLVDGDGVVPADGAAAAPAAPTGPSAAELAQRAEYIRSRIYD